MNKEDYELTALLDEYEKRKSQDSAEKKSLADTLSEIENRRTLNAPQSRTGAAQYEAESRYGLTLDNNENDIIFARENAEAKIQKTFDDYEYKVKSLALGLENAKEDITQDTIKQGIYYSTIRDGLLSDKQASYDAVLNKTLNEASYALEEIKTGLEQKEIEYETAKKHYKLRYALAIEEELSRLMEDKVYATRKELEAYAALQERHMPAFNEPAPADTEETPPAAVESPAPSYDLDADKLPEVPAVSSSRYRLNKPVLPATKSVASLSERGLK
ncbi:MAG: hypothetical protein LBN25_04915 [Christensenellaceae bacterium]|jgi:hypothetical protein|nr:hypothetical protein [Christensenellaceae bacterium]